MKPAAEHLSFKSHKREREREMPLTNGRNEQAVQLQTALEWLFTHLTSLKALPYLPSGSVSDRSKTVTANQTMKQQPDIEWASASQSISEADCLSNHPSVHLLTGSLFRMFKPHNKARIIN